MHQAVLKIDFVNEPDKNPDFGSVKADGKYWGIPKDMLPKFQKGETYTVGYTTTEGRTGKTFYNIKEIMSQAQAPATGHNNPPNGDGSDKDVKIGALALFKTVWTIEASRDENAVPLEDRIVYVLERCAAAYRKVF